ncbi:hypothetical protein FDP41_010131 [Naegleria fowleri]|uniref:Acetyl-CoA acetyltransferase n=2 Tax=Naegleria fowleri TaxID=5763 RepID=A0A6A5B8N5_NAEFO|nr:uncharacterized protein FDP41_010131 [Naegleria fowleri]KAF0971602.1 hypothetical protein FDP41_010131 [Naegleria fowleri]CAG4710047.1 unnamed protein product [Naegleria fowleri]
MTHKTRAVIVAAQRTPIGSFLGKLSGFDAPKLGSLAIRSATQKAGVALSEVQEVIMGNVVSANLGQAPARQASIHAGLPESVVCTTVNKMCASGMKAVMYGTQNIELGIHNCVVAGGFESMSNAPYYIPQGRSGYRLGDGKLVDSILKDGLTDAYNGEHMGWCAEQTAKLYKITREEQDAYAIESYKRAAEANEKGYMSEELFSIALPSKKKGDPIQYIQHDEEFTNINMDKVPQLKPAFVKENGTVTAANSSKLSDGGAALILMSEEKAKKAGIRPIARILGYGDAEKAPIDFTTAPSSAIPVALKHAGVLQSDVNLWEINEAFSAVALVNMRLLGLDVSNVNIFGGAVALGHPIGCSGARILCTLISALKHRKQQVGCAAICNGGGGASSVVIELL